MNFIDVTVRSEAGATSVEAEGLRLTVGAADARALAARNGRRVIMGMRPEHLVLGDGAPGLASMPASKSSNSSAPRSCWRRGLAAPASRLPACPPKPQIARGDQVRLSAQPGRLHFFDPETELPISA